MKLFLLSSLVCTQCFCPAQVVILKDTLAMQTLNQVVVTATRTSKNVKDLPIPFLQISSTEIKNRGIIRLNDILAEQTGLAVINNHGQGIQIQGFSPDYTLILIDGEPLIGRTSGTLELSRVATANVDRIEIIKGPASSLYGSEAMAGVINIITKNPINGFTSNFISRYGTNNNTDLALDAGYKNQNFSLSGFVNRNSSTGYSLQPQLGTPTVSPFFNYTLTGKLTYKINTKTNLNIGLRYFDDNQTDRFTVDNRFIAGQGAVNDYNFAPTFSHQFTPKLLSTLRLYQSGYKTKSVLNYEDNATKYDESFFNQTFSRAELQNDYTFTHTFKLTAGAGVQRESVEATRYDNIKAFTSGYGYLQADWQPIKKMNILLGARYDTHSEYQAQFSPKIAANYIFSKRFTVLASVGRGYKAPDFRQLYLNFTNPVAGYSVFGYNEAAARVAQFEQEGQIQAILIDAATLQNLNAESSTSFNLGFKAQPFTKINWSVNVFRNNVQNLISSAPIAIKTNGQSVFSYFNLNRIYTQGIETDLGYQLIKNIELGGGLQYLQAYDQAVLDKIARSEVFTRNPISNLTEAVKRKNYGGLPNRSKYMANARMVYNNDKKDFSTSIRAIYRGRYGLGDSNGNGIIDQDNEYVKGYVLFNASISKSILKNKLRLQATADNVFDFKNPDFIANLPGRLLYFGLSYRISK